MEIRKNMEELEMGDKKGKKDYFREGRIREDDGIERETIRRKRGRGRGRNREKKKKKRGMERRKE